MGIQLRVAFGFHEKLASELKQRDARWNYTAYGFGLREVLFVFRNTEISLQPKSSCFLTCLKLK